MKRFLGFIYKVGYPVAKTYWFVARPTTRGVRCIVIHNDEILLVKHTYGNPLKTTVGGGVNKDESLDQAVRREVREEVGIELNNVAEIGTILYTEEFKNDTIHVFIAEAKTRELVLDKSEILEAHWCPLHSLHKDTSPLLYQFLDLAKAFIQEMPAAAK